MIFIDIVGPFLSPDLDLVQGLYIELVGVLACKTLLLSLCSDLLLRVSGVFSNVLLLFLDVFLVFGDTLMNDSQI